MKKQDFNEIKILEIKALLAKVKIVQGEIANLIMDKNMSKLKDLKSISKKRKDIAQIMTVLNQKRLIGELESKNKVEEKEK